MKASDLTDERLIIEYVGVKKEEKLLYSRKKELEQEMENRYKKAFEEHKK